MPETLISILQDRGLEISQISKEDGGQEWLEGIYRIKDQERLIFLIDVGFDNLPDIDSYVDGLMDLVTYEGLSVGIDSVVEIRGKYSMREILWDIYGIFVSRVSETRPGIADEEIYRIQRDNHLMKRYIVQGPVCGGVEFYDGEEDGKAKLLSIIGKAISDGDEAVSACNEEIVSCRKWIHRVEESYRRWVWEKYTSERGELEQKINQWIQILSEKLGQMIQCNNKMRNSVRIQHERTQEKVNTYEAFVQKYGVEKKLLGLKIENTKKANQWIKSLLLEKFQIQTDAVEAPEEGEKKRFRQLIKKLDLEKKAFDVVLGILKYDLGKENLDLLRKYAAADAGLSELEKKQKLYQEAIDFRKNVSGVARDIEKEMIQKYIMNNEMINLVFQYINPHPFYRQFQIVKSGAETNMVPMEKNGGDIYLDHLFSEAQLRVLSLSIFLGLSLSAKDNDFCQIYIDDPVQSMDDINMVSFIDLLRALKRSNKVDKNLIIGTHDFNFSKLLKIKFRYHSYMEYYFDSYTREGPKIVKRYDRVN